MQPIRPTLLSVNQTLPSEPMAIPPGCTIATIGIWKLVTERESMVRPSSRGDSEAPIHNSRFRLNLRESSWPERPSSSHLVKLVT